MKGILIIGGTSAIAVACARLWAAQGCRLFLVARNTEKMEQTAADLRARGAGAVTTFCMDAADLDAHAPMLDACVAALGQVDITLIAHGTLPDQKACEQDVQLALRELVNNGCSVIALVIRLANLLEAQCCGSLGVISSVAGDRGRPSNYVYGTAKAAVSTFLEGLRPRLFKAGVHVTDIRPGFVATPMTRHLDLPALLVARPDTVAARIVKAIERHDDTVYVPGYWALIMLAIRSIPQPIFKRMHL